jgi:hypothetical protein
MKTINAPWAGLRDAQWQRTAAGDELQAQQEVQP